MAQKKRASRTGEKVVPIAPAMGQDEMVAILNENRNLEKQGGRRFKVQFMSGDAPGTESGASALTDLMRSCKPQGAEFHVVSDGIVAMHQAIASGKFTGQRTYVFTTGSSFGPHSKLHAAALAGVISRLERE